MSLGRREGGTLRLTLNPEVNCLWTPWVLSAVWFGLLYARSSCSLLGQEPSVFNEWGDMVFWENFWPKTERLNPIPLRIMGQAEALSRHNLSKLKNVSFGKRKKVIYLGKRWFFSGTPTKCPSCVRYFCLRFSHQPCDDYYFSLTCWGSWDFKRPNNLFKLSQIRKGMVDGG